MNRTFDTAGTQSQVPLLAVASTVPVAVPVTDSVPVLHIPDGTLLNLEQIPGRVNPSQSAEEVCDTLRLSGAVSESFIRKLKE